MAVDGAWQTLIEEIHASGRSVVLAITGGGSGAIGALLRVPGGSRTLLEAIVPYDEPSLAQFLAGAPGQACSEATAVAMARQARERARALSPTSAAPVGVGATASLVSDRPKKGEHRCHIAVATGEGFALTSIGLDKGRRDRASEEELVAGAIVTVLARACGVAAPSLTSLLGPGDQLAEDHRLSADPLVALLAGSIERLTCHPDGQLARGADVPGAVLPGSFNPLHAGHIGMARVASGILATPVAFELSVTNVDKPALGEAEVGRRLRQFAWRHVAELTRAPTFREKARLFPGATFVVGMDTAERIAQPRYYGDSEAAMRTALGEIAGRGCRFLVAGRVDGSGRFATVSEASIPPEYRGLFSGIPEEQFRNDLSSTALRRRDS
jgi:nicotinamide mononucleotide (NMN) deamidase PncC